MTTKTPRRSARVMGRVLRYTFLILTLLLLGACAWSWRYLNAVEYRGDYHWTVLLNQGNVTFHTSMASMLTRDRGLWGFRQTDAMPDDWGVSPNLQFGDFAVVNLSGFGVYDFTGVRVPIWMILTLVLIPTAALWYRPLRDRWRGKHLRGFEVETKSPDPGQA